MLVESGVHDSEDKSFLGTLSQLKGKIISATIIIGVIVAVIFIFYVGTRRTGYKAWLVGTAGNCFIKLETLYGDLYNVTCFSEFDENGELYPWAFQTGIADNKDGFYYAAFKHFPDGNLTNNVLSVAKLDLKSGELIEKYVLPSTYINFLYMLVDPHTASRNYANLYGVAMYQSNNTIVQGIGKISFVPGNPSISIVSDWPNAPAPGSCCKEGGEEVCFHQPALQFDENYLYPECKSLNEWNVTDGNKTTRSFDYNMAVLLYYPRIYGLLTISMLPTPNRVAMKQPDIGIIQGGRLTQLHVLENQAERSRVPLDGTIDEESNYLYVLLGEPGPTGSGTATKMRIYTIDMSETGINNFKIVQITDLDPALVYPRDLKNLNFLMTPSEDEMG